MSLDWTDYFISAVPPRLTFELGLDELVALVNAHEEADTSMSNTTAQVCLIGLAAHFEAFCKGLFAAVVNICPDLLADFCETRNVTIDIRLLLKVKDSFDYRLGSLLAEEYDFGSAKTINSLFFDLIHITAFSKDNQKKYAEFLNDRNLLVHHGGVFTFRYEGQRFATKEGGPRKNRVHLDSLIIRKKEFNHWAKFLDALSDKMATAVHRTTTKLVSEKGFKLGPQRKHALEALIWKFNTFTQKMADIAEERSIS
jgi:hypothetical protein